MDKNLEYVNEIVNTMEKYTSGDYFIYNGKLFTIDERDFFRNTRLYNPTGKCHGRHSHILYNARRRSNF